MTDHVEPDPCPSFTDLMLASEGELPPPEGPQVMAHFNRCAKCQAAWARSDEVMRVWYAHREQQREDDRERRRRRRRRTRRRVDPLDLKQVEIDVLEKIYAVEQDHTIASELTGTDEETGDTTNDATRAAAPAPAVSSMPVASDPTCAADVIDVTNAIDVPAHVQGPRFEPVDVTPDRVVRDLVAHASASADHADVVDDADPVDAAPAEPARVAHEERAVSHAIAARMSPSAEPDVEHAAPARLPRNLRTLRRRRAQPFRHAVRRGGPLPIARWSRRIATSRITMAAAAIVAVLTVGSFLEQSSSVVSAEELLARAVQHERVLPDGGQRVRVSLSAPSIASASRGSMTSVIPPFSTVRTVTRSASSLAPLREARSARLELAADAADASEADGLPTALTAVLDAHLFDWRRPLSTHAFLAWHATRARPHDRVTLSRDMVYVLRTTTPEGLIRQAELFVRHADAHVIRTVLLIDGIGRLEFAEIDTWVRTDPPRAPTTPAVPSRAIVTADAVQLAELDARLVLRHANADLGGLVRIVSKADMVHVDGAVPDAAQRRAVLQGLAQLPIVRVSLRADAASPSPSSVLGVAPGVASGAHGDDRADETSSALARWGASKFRTPAQYEAFEQQLARHASSLRLHLDALAALAVRYPELDAQRLTPGARAKLDQLVNLHYVAVRANLEGLDDNLATIVDDRAVRVRSLTRGTASWRSRVGAGVEPAQAIERLVSTWRDPAASVTIDNAAPEIERFQQAFKALWNAINPSDSATASSAAR